MNIPYVITVSAPVSLLKRSGYAKTLQIGRKSVAY